MNHKNTFLFITYNLLLGFLLLPVIFISVIGIPLHVLIMWLVYDKLLNYKKYKMLLSLNKTLALSAIFQSLVGTTLFISINDTSDFIGIKIMVFWISILIFSSLEALIMKYLLRNI